MRAVEVAKRIGISTQELRRELGLVNFGIKPTDREIPDSVASGVIRVLRMKYPDRTPLIEDEPEVETTEAPAESEAESPESEKKEEEEPVAKKVKKKSKQSIDNITFIKQPEVVEEPKAKEAPAKAGKRKKTNWSKEAPEEEEVTFEEEETPTKVVSKPKKRVKITHKLTLDDVGDEGDIAELEEEMMAQEMERSLIKEQKKKKAKTQKVVKKEDQEQVQIKAKTGVVELPEVISVKEFAEKTGVQVPKIISELMKNGILATINQDIDYETAALIAAEFGVDVKRQAKDISSEELLAGNLETLLKEEDPEHLQTRPPIVTIMGHVDHGKTQLLDTIRDTNVIAKESGGITQHIGAYQVQHNEHKITFIDTPGHEAFTSMRARGAKVTDIAILVVAADEGMKPQTIEAMNHAKDAGVPIIVAINKIDKDGANVDRVKGQLAEHELTPEDWGGKTITVPLSALTGENIPQLLEMILLVAEVEDFKANPNRSAVGTVVEAHLDPSLGPVATVLVNTGTLKMMDNFVVGTTSGRVKRMVDHLGTNVKDLPPSGVAQIAGFDKVPVAGDVLQVMKSEKAVRQKIQEVQELHAEQARGGKGGIMDEIIRRIHSGRMKSLKLILKADTKGSLEAISQALAKIESDEVVPKIVHAGVGDISETDVMMAAAGDGVVMGFHVGINNQVRGIADKEGVECRKYEVIYDLVDDVKRILSGLLEPEKVETVLGSIEIREVFLTKKKSFIIGGKVTNGVVKTKTPFRVMRDGENVGEGTIKSLRRIQEQVEEMKAGNECGLQVETEVKIQAGDVLEDYVVEEVERTL